MFTDDMEFYHDKGGLTNREQTREGFAKMFGNSPDIRRELVPGSLQVYPIKDFGARLRLGRTVFAIKKMAKTIAEIFHSSWSGAKSAIRGKSHASLATDISGSWEIALRAFCFYPARGRVSPARAVDRTFDQILLLTATISELPSHASAARIPSSAHRPRDAAAVAWSRSHLGRSASRGLRWRPFRIKHRPAGKNILHGIIASLNSTGQTIGPGVSCSAILLRPSRANHLHVPCREWAQLAIAMHAAPP